MLLAHTACPNDKLYNWLSLHPADVDFHQTSSPLLFHKYCCNSHSSRMQMYQGGRELRSKFTEVKEEGFHSHLLDVSYSDVRTVPLFSPNQWSYTPHPLPTPSPSVELILIPRLHSDHGQIKRKKRKKEREWLSNVFM